MFFLRKANRYWIFPFLRLQRNREVAKQIGLRSVTERVSCHVNEENKKLHRPDANLPETPISDSEGVSADKVNKKGGDTKIPESIEAQKLVGNYKKGQANH